MSKEMTQADTPAPQHHVVSEDVVAIGKMWASMHEGKPVADIVAAAVQAERDLHMTQPPQQNLEGPQPCGIADPSTRDCPNMKEVGGGMDGERYRCAVCGKGYFLDYEDMK